MSTPGCARPVASRRREPVSVDRSDVEGDISRVQRFLRTSRGDVYAGRMVRGPDPTSRGTGKFGNYTLELMPIAQFPGSRNWGYDGVFPFAPQNTYGGPEGLQRLVNAAHSQ